MQTSAESNTTDPNMTSEQTEIIRPQLNLDLETEPQGSADLDLLLKSVFRTKADEPAPRPILPAFQLPEPKFDIYSLGPSLNPSDLSASKAEELHDWFAIPIGNQLLMYDSEIVHPAASNVLISLGLVAQSLNKGIGNLVIAAGASYGLLGDVSCLKESRSSVETAKYGLGSTLNAAIIASAVSSFTQAVPNESRLGIVCCGLMGRMLLELIPNLVSIASVPGQLESKDQSS